MSPDKLEFIPAKPSPFLIKVAQRLIQADLALNNRLHLHDRELEQLRDIPKDSGILLTSNHADETDPLICMELSRRTGRRFISMCNREAFDELFGMAGWGLQRLGHFSVKRGAHDAPAKNYAIEVVRRGNDVLVIFPEGEIFYLNEMVQPFHSGAIEIGMQAIVENRRSNPNYTAHIVPMAIKYHYSKPIDDILEQRISKMERELSLTVGQGEMPQRLRNIQHVLLKRAEVVHNLKEASDPAYKSDNLTEKIITAQKAILEEVEKKHPDLPVSKFGQTIDKSWQLGAEIREELHQDSGERDKKELLGDIDALREVAELASWNPQYYKETNSLDRFAEVVMKLERELYGIKRPKQLAARKAFVKIAEPIDLGPFVDQYVADSHSIRREITGRLRAQIQSLVDALSTTAPRVR